jgi:hypothetical protein
MSSHEEFLELCASATAGEVTVEERAKLDAHLAECPDCRRAMSEYEAAARTGVAALAQHFALKNEAVDGSWSAEDAEKAFFKRLDREQGEQGPKRIEYDPSEHAKLGKRFTYRPSQFRWREIWMPFAAAVLLSLALGVAAYRTGIRKGTDVARTTPQPATASESSLEERASDAGHERAQLEARLAENAKVIEDLKRQLPDGQYTQVAGCVIARQRPGTAKGFVFLSLEDETGISNVIVHPDLYETARKVINADKFLRVEGVLQNQDATISIKAHRVLPLSITRAQTESHDFH